MYTINLNYLFRETLRGKTQALNRCVDLQ